jgi:hypothetical protein
MDPRVRRNVCPRCLKEKAITTLERCNSMPKSNSSCNLLLHTTLVNCKVCDRRFPSLDICVVHIDRDIGYLTQTEPEFLPLVNRNPIVSIPRHDIGLFVMKASVHML